METAITNYPWAEELEKTVISSLVTTFGLDFLLFKDKDGGDVDTIQNARKGVYATDKEQQQYEQRGEYDKPAYQKDENYKAAGVKNKTLHQTGELHDGYRNQIMKPSENFERDHIIATVEIHNDAGRILAEFDGVELANKNSNLQATLETINKSKKEKSVSNYLDRLPSLIQDHKKTLERQQQRLESMPRETPEQKHNYQKKADEIRKLEEKIKNLKSIDPDAMKEKDRQARAAYEDQISTSYYTSSKFLKATVQQAGISGLKMGTRQMLGLVMAEIWFELRIQIPKILENIKQRFDLEKFIANVKDTLQGIWRRIQTRFHDFLIAFKDGVFAGVMASVTTTIFNIFATTQKATIKIIRESWGQLVKALKLMFFNPEKLGPTDLCKALTGIISTAAGVIIGSMIHAELLPLCGFPFGSELAIFAGALTTGLVTLGLTYVLLHSEFSQKAWNFFESIMPHAGKVREFEVINAELDNYLVELARIEFNMDPEELAEFSSDLAACNDEMQRNLALRDEITRRDIGLPYEMGNTVSTRIWLTSLAK